MNVTEGGMHLLARVEAMLAHHFNNELVVSEEELEEAFKIMEVFSTKIYNCSELEWVWWNDLRPQSPAGYYIYIFNGGRDVYLKRGREIKVTMTLYTDEIEIKNCFTETAYQIEKNLDIGPYFLSTVTEYGLVEHLFSSIDELLAHFNNSLSVNDGNLSDDDINDTLFSD